MNYSVLIFDTSARHIKTYHDILKIQYFDILDSWIDVPKSEFLTYKFPTDCNYQLLSEKGNYNIDKSIIGTFEVVTQN